EPKHFCRVHDVIVQGDICLEQRRPFGGVTIVDCSQKKDVASKCGIKHPALEDFTDVDEGVGVGGGGSFASDRWGGEDRGGDKRGCPRKEADAFYLLHGMILISDLYVVKTDLQIGSKRHTKSRYIVPYVCHKCAYHVFIKYINTLK